MRIVIDGSITGSWCFEDETTPESERVLAILRAGQASVPAIWPTEVANTLLTGIKRNRITVAAATQFIEILRDLDISIENPHDDLHALLSSARNHGLTVYDATYVDLALRHQLPLASLDTQMREAASKAGVALLP